MKNELELWPNPEKSELAIEIGMDVLTFSGNESEASAEKIGHLQDTYEMYLKKVASKHCRFLDLLHLAKMLAMSDAAFNVYERSRNRRLLIWPYRIEDDPFSFNQAESLGLRMLYPMGGNGSETGT